MLMDFLRFLHPYFISPMAIAPQWCGQIRHGTSSLALMCFVLLSVKAGLAQAPVITSDSVVNAGSYAQPITPGSIVSIFGSNLAATTVTAQGMPLPTALAGTSVTMNGIKAPLFFVSPGQINLQAPWELQSGLDISEAKFASATVTVQTTTATSAPVQVPIYQFGPAIFSMDASGCGRAAALNVAPDGRTSLNSPSNSAAPGDYVSVFGTGFGLLYFPPPDGMPAAGAQQTIAAGGVSLNGQALAGYWYNGVAPGLVGANQVNFQIPLGASEGCAVPVAVLSPLISPTLAISIHTGRRQCVDPPIQSYGQVMLTKTVTTGTANAGETDTLTAVFPSGPGLKPLVPQGPPFGTVASYPPVPVSRACPVPGYADLSAGTIQVQAINSGASVAAQPISQTGGVAYQQTLPAGFIAPGPYTITSSGGPVVFRAGLSIDSPIQIQTPFPAGTTISSSKPLTVKWAGGVPGYVVKVTLTSGRGFLRASDYGYVDAGTGSYTILGTCSGYPSPVCSLGLPMFNDAEVDVEVTPGSPISVPAQGITNSVQAFWTYRFVFGGIIVGP